MTEAETKLHRRLIEAAMVGASDIALALAIELRALIQNQEAVEAHFLKHGGNDGALDSA